MVGLCFKAKSIYFGEAYSCDVDCQELYEEILDSRTLQTNHKKIFKQLLNYIAQYGDENAFPNMRIALQILLTIAGFYCLLRKIS